MNVDVAVKDWMNPYVAALRIIQLYSSANAPPASQSAGFMSGSNRSKSVPQWCREMPVSDPSSPSGHGGRTPSHRRAFNRQVLRPRAGALELACEAEQHGFAGQPADELDPHREPVGGLVQRQADRRPSGDVG